MHAIFASLGTDGDILPFLGVALKLRERGHRITFLAAESYAELVAAHGLEFRELISAEFMCRLFGNPDVWHPIKTAWHTTKLSCPLIEPQYRLFDSIVAEHPDAVLVANPAVFGASIVSEARARPLCHIILQPWFIHSAIAPSLMPVAGVPRWAPRLMHSLLYYALDVVADLRVGPTLNRVRRSAGLKPMRRIIHNWFARDLVIGMFPEWFGPPQKDWPPQVRLADFPRFDGAIDRSPPPGLPEFLSNSKPTVAFTFGSGMMHAEQLFELAARVCADIDCQAIFISRHHKPAQLPAHVFHADFIPFRDVFPRCAAVVHHGGIGTTAEALATGTPQLILPIGFDQLDNGDRVQTLGAGIHTASKHRLIVKANGIREADIAEVASGLKRLLQPEFRERCRVIAGKLRASDGLSTAATWIETLAQSKT